ncbi:type II secretion system protein [Nostoc sp. UHCC 0702]|nr:type II secretion system protein [Nostoc sp. UHCC 0702]
MYNLVLGKKLQKIPLKLLLKLNNDSQTKQKNDGFSLIELLVVVIMLGVLATIAAPSWFAFVNRQRVNKANDFILSALQEAQREAKKQKLSYSVSFRTYNNIPQVAIYSKGSDSSNFLWRDLGGDLGIKAGQIVIGTNITNENTASSIITYASTPTFTTSKPQTITYDYTGALDLLVKTNTNGLTAVQNDKIGTKGLVVAVAIAKPGSPSQATSVKRCIIVKTLLGSTKIGKDTECN